MNHSEMGDLQDALAFSGLVPQSCIPTFDELESWTARDVAETRAWIASGGRLPTPTVWHEAIARYHAPRPQMARAPRPETWAELMEAHGDDELDWTLGRVRVPR